jgi:hypothetical protein
MKSDYDSDDHIKNMQNPEANKYCPNGNPVLKFAGRDWWINYHWNKETGIYQDSNFNSIWNPKIIERTSDGVRLWIKPPDPTLGKSWQTSEIVCVDKVPHGRYLVTARADGGSFSNLDNTGNAVFGVFTYQYSDAPPPPDLPPGAKYNTHREIDMMEVWRGGTSNAQFGLQPWDYSPPPFYYMNLPDNTPVITILTDWYIDQGYNPNVFNAVFLGDYSLETLPSTPYKLWVPGHHGFLNLIPNLTATSCARFHINLWLKGGKAPSKPLSVTVTRFQYAPKSG